MIKEKKEKMKINKQQDTSFHHKKDQSTFMHRTISKMTNTLKGIKALRKKIIHTWIPCTVCNRILSRAPGVKVMSTSMKSIKSFSSHWPAPNSKAKARAKLVFACVRRHYAVIVEIRMMIKM